MQKIMFNNKYGLTDAVLQGRKTMTRRIAYDGEIKDIHIGYMTEGVDAGRLALCDGNMIVAKSKYKLGEVVAVAQAYKDIEEYNPESYEDVMLDQGTICEASHPYSHLMKSGGWDNKMFVRADLMPLKIQITDIKVERLQDISNEDCLKEGVFLDVTAPECYQPFYTFVNSKTKDNTPIGFENPQYAFQVLIDKLSGFGTWDRNDWQFAYTFELMPRRNV